MPAKAGNSAMITGRTAVPLYRNGAGERTPTVRPSRSRCTLGSVVFVYFFLNSSSTEDGAGRGGAGRGGATSLKLIPEDFCENRENAETPK